MAKTLPSGRVRSETLSEMIACVKECVREIKEPIRPETLDELYAALSTTFLAEQRKTQPDRAAICQLRQRLQVVGRIKQVVGSKFRLRDL